jgi:hypothetical protein
MEDSPPPKHKMKTEDPRYKIKTQGRKNEKELRP